MSLSSIFSSGGSAQAPLSTSTASVSEAKKQLQQQISQELAVANATELVNKVTENCFEKCVAVPGPSLTATQQDCTRGCMDKYMHSWNLISRTYIGRIQQASATGQI